MTDVSAEPRCWFCGETELIEVGCYTRLDFGAGGVQLCCDNCFEKADPAELGWPDRAAADDE